jgi:hypothetical protein
MRGAVPRYRAIVTLDGDGDPPLRLPAVVVGHWNGWSVPALTRGAVDTLWSWLHELDPRDTYTVMHWDQDVLVITHSDGATRDEDPAAESVTIDRISPSGGLYVLDIGWTFYDVSEEDS